MTSSCDNRFQGFFDDENYLVLKNDLYNYLIRKRAVEKAMRDEEIGTVLEVGSGISPVLTSGDRMVYSDLSFSALDTLKRLHGKGRYVVADGMSLPFRAEAFSHVICSEVLEHLEDDRRALREIVASIKPGGCLVITFPHRRFYFAHDDRYVHHHRRYELPEMILRLKEAGLHTVAVRKVLGPLEKITMILVTKFIAVLKGTGDVQRVCAARSKRPPGAVVSIYKWANRMYAVFAWLDALVMPRALSAVLLIKAIKK